MPGGLKFGLKTKKKPVYGLIMPSQFGALDDGEDEEADVQAQIDATNRRRAKRAQKEMEKVLSVDSSAYQYDEVYDEMKTPAAQKEQEHRRDRLERKPKYIQALMDQAKEREMEQNIIYDRMKVKEIEREKATFGDTEKFVTGAYRRELEKREKWLKRRDALDAMDKDVTTEGDYRLKLMSSVMGGRNVAAGGVAKERKLEEPETSKVAQKDEERTNNKRAHKEIDTPSQRRELKDGDASSSTATSTTTTTTSSSSSTTTTMVEAPPSSPSNGSKRAKRTSGLEIEEHLDPLLARQARKERITREMNERRNDKDAVSAARARYLERKRKREQGNAS